LFVTSKRLTMMDKTMKKPILAIALCSFIGLFSPAMAFDYLPMKKDMCETIIPEQAIIHAMEGPGSWFAVNEVNVLAAEKHFDGKSCIGAVVTTQGELDIEVKVIHVARVPNASLEDTNFFLEVDYMTIANMPLFLK
jgi:hypothetical protein